MNKTTIIILAILGMAAIIIGSIMIVKDYSWSLVFGILFLLFGNNVGNKLNQ